jgi:ABC-type branched-subunit amino acid transport system permease subunit
VWDLWTLSGNLLHELGPAGYQARAVTLKVVFINPLLMLILLVRPRGFPSEEAVVSRRMKASAEEVQEE